MRFLTWLFNERTTTMQSADYAKFST